MEDHPILFFDGVCNFCNSSVQFVIRHDPKGIFQFAPLQSDIARQLLAPHNINPDALDSTILLDGGRVYLYADVALRIAPRFGGIWKLAVIFYIVPRVLRNAVYNLIARNRYKWFGKKDACMIPSPNVRARFLDFTVM